MKFNTLNDLSYKVFVPNKTGYLNLTVSNMIMRMNELKTLTKHILCECKWKFDGKKCNLNNCQCECKNSKKTLRVWKGLYLESCCM